MNERILWIEEEAEQNLNEFKTYLVNMDYLLDIAKSPGEAESKLQASEYDLIIFDIRIIPGEGAEWVGMHQAGEKRLGLRLLEKLTKQRPELKNKIVIFSNELYSDVSKELLDAGISKDKFKRKREANIPEEFDAFIIHHLSHK